MNNAKYLRVASDLHLECMAKSPTKTLEMIFLPIHEKDSESILVLAGDISSIPEQLINFIAHIEGRFLSVVYVPGNHEFYNHDINVWKEQTAALFRDNTKNTYFALDNIQQEKILGINFIFGTLWADGGPTNIDKIMVSRGLSDFRLIANNNRGYSVYDMVEINYRDRINIEEFLIKDTKEIPTVIVTHHLPSYKLCHPRFGTDINGGFASNCDELITKYRPNLWIHGHTHDTMDTMIYSTRIVCNPYGYATENRNSQFNVYDACFLDVSEL